MPPRLHPGREHFRVLTIVCREPSHNGRETLITRFREDVDGSGRRVGIDTVQSTRRPRGSFELTTERVQHEQGGAGEPPTLGVNLRPPTVRLTWLDETGHPLGREEAYERGDEDHSQWHWRYRFWCSTCGLNVPARSENLMAVLHKLFDADVLVVQLGSLAGILRSK